jgi:hypothetical protein
MKTDRIQGILFPENTGDGIHPSGHRKLKIQTRTVTDHLKHLVMPHTASALTRPFHWRKRAGSARVRRSADRHYAELMTADLIERLHIRPRGK